MFLWYFFKSTEYNTMGSFNPKIRSRLKKKNQKLQNKKKPRLLKRND